jgi:integrase
MSGIGVFLHSAAISNASIPPNMKSTFRAGSNMLGCSPFAIYGHKIALLETCRNPVKKVLIPGSEDADYKARVLEPEETLTIIDRLDYPEKILVVLVAVTAVRISEALALRWRHVNFVNECIRIEQAFRLSEITTTKTKSSKANVPMCGLLAEYHRHWRSQTPYHRDNGRDKVEGKILRRLQNQRWAAVTGFSTASHTQGH